MFKERSFSESFSNERLSILEQYSSTEIDPENHRAFLSICHAFGVTDKVVCTSDSELVGVFQRFKMLCKSFGIDISHSFGTLLEATLLREEAERMDKECDQMEIEFAKSKERMAEVYIKRLKLEEMHKEKRQLEETLQEINRDMVHAEVSKEIVGLSRSLSLDLRESKQGTLCPVNSEYVEEFHALFLPFVSLSIEAVNFLCSQLSISHPVDMPKSVAISKYIDNLRGVHQLKTLKKKPWSQRPGWTVQL